MIGKGIKIPLIDHHCNPNHSPFPTRFDFSLFTSLSPRNPQNFLGSFHGTTCTSITFGIGILLPFFPTEFFEGEVYHYYDTRFYLQWIGENTTTMIIDRSSFE
jgi:hypothetical protein